MEVEERSTTPSTPSSPVPAERPPPCSKPSDTTSTIAASGGAGSGAPARGGLDRAAVLKRILDQVVKAALFPAPEGSELTSDRLAADMDSFARELAGPDPTPTERMLAEVAAVCWADLRINESVYLCNRQSPKIAAIHQGFVSRSHRRLMSTLRTLAVVQKLAVPAIQVNVARRQVNQQLVAPPPALKEHKHV
jgi:hypothetical protein